MGEFNNKDDLLNYVKILIENKGNSELFLYFTFPDKKTSILSVSKDLKIEPSDEVIQEIEALLGDDSIRFE